MISTRTLNIVAGVLLGIGGNILASAAVGNSRDPWILVLLGLLWSVGGSVIVWAADIAKIHEDLVARLSASTLQPGEIAGLVETSKAKFRPRIRRLMGVALVIILAATAAGIRLV